MGGKEYVLTCDDEGKMYLENEKEKIYTNECVIDKRGFVVLISPDELKKTEREHVYTDENDKLYFDVAYVSWDKFGFMSIYELLYDSY